MNILRKLFGMGQGSGATKKVTLRINVSFIVVAGKTPSVTPAYEAAELKLVQRVVKEKGIRNARVKTFRGPALPDSNDPGAVEAFVRVFQVQTGQGMVDFQTEFYKQDGYEFLVIYM